MPKIRRWFNVSHDINSDPEVWELTDKFGVAGLRLWLELLSIGDRNEGNLPELSRATVRQLSIKCNTPQTRASAVCDWCVTRTWIVCDPRPRLRNYRNYRPSRETKKETVVPPPNSPDLTDLTNVTKDTDESPSVTPDPPFFSVQDFVDTWNQFFKDTSLPKVEWPLSAGRQRKAALRCKEHKSEEFWRKVFDNIAASKFLMGSKNGTWKCTFDFLIANDTNLLKIYEGSYK